jgi:hypothetical protein
MSDPTHNQAPPDRTVKIPHLVFGLLFLGIAAVWALVASDVVTGDRLTWLGPAILVGAGVIGLAASLASTRNRRNKTQPDYQPVSYPVSSPEVGPETNPYSGPDVYADSRDDVAAEPDIDDRTDENTKEIR